MKKHLPLQLLFAALILVCGGYCYCNPTQRMTSAPNYDSISPDKPKKVIDVEKPHAVCVADSGIFAIVSYKRNGIFYMYSECGNLIKAVNLPSGSKEPVWHCTFSGDNLYLIAKEKKIYKYSTDGKFIKVMASGEYYSFITSCGDQLFVTARKNLISYQNEKEVFRVEVSSEVAREPVVDLNKNLRITTHTGEVLYYSLKGQKIKSTIYEGLRKGNGMAIDTAGNILIVDRYKHLLVYSPCGKLIKTIKPSRDARPLDVEIGNDGSIILVDGSGKVLIY